MKNVTAIFIGESKRKDKYKGAGAQSFAGLPFIIVKEWRNATDKAINHEKIHMFQALEMLYIPFVIFYVGNYFWNLIRGMNLMNAYKNIIFEREAYDNEDNLEYIKTRLIWSWINYWKINK